MISRWSRALLLALASLAVLAGCTTFGNISWRNAMIVFRTPDVLPDRIEQPRRDDVRLSALWVGHSTVLLQMDDKFILTDPVFTRYVGMMSVRLVEPGIAPENLPDLDAVLISHRHFDHLSTGSFAKIASRLKVVLTPPGAAADVPSGRYAVEELPVWSAWERTGLRVTAVPARHSGGRLAGDSDSHPEAFTGYVVQYHGMTVFFAGDTAYDETMFKEVAARFDAIDLALMPIGPIEPAPVMSPHHMNPAQALAASRILGAREMLPIHFATFVNSYDEAGTVEAAFERALEETDGTMPHASLWRTGEQRIVRHR